MITEETCRSGLVIHLGNGVSIHSEQTKFTHVDGKRIVNAPGEVQFKMMFGKTWLGPLRHFAHDPDGTIRQCNPLSEMETAFTPKRKTWLQRVFA